MLHILEPQVFTQQCKKCQTQIPFFSPHDYSFFPLNFSLLVIVLVYAVKNLHASFSNVPRSLSQLFFSVGHDLASSTHIICS